MRSLCGGMVDTADSKSAIARCVGSSPTKGTFICMKLFTLEKFAPDSTFQIKDQNDIDYCGDEELLIKHKSILVTKEDFNVKNGIFKIPLDGKIKTLGLSATGIVEKRGKNVKSFNEGDTIIYPSCSNFGAYSEKRLINYNYCISVPENINLNLACGTFRKILAARYFLLKLIILNEGDLILITKAEYEFGIFLVKIAKKFNLKIIALTSNQDLIGKIFSFGADFILHDKDPDLEKKILEYTENKGVKAVFDQQGSEIFDKLTKIVRTFGYYIYYGYPVGDMKQIDITEIKNKNLNFICASFEMLHFDRYDFILNSIEIFKTIEEFQSLQILKYRFEDLNQAYKDFENSKGLSSTILVF